jgi:hypothetical protein
MNTQNTLQTNKYINFIKFSTITQLNKWCKFKIYQIPITIRITDKNESKSSSKNFIKSKILKFQFRIFKKPYINKTLKSGSITLLMLSSSFKSSRGKVVVVSRERNRTKIRKNKFHRKSHKEWRKKITQRMGKSGT